MQALFDRFSCTAAVDGWVLFVTGVHEESTNEDLKDHFSDCGKVLNCWMNLDRQTGYVKVNTDSLQQPVVQ